MAASRAGAPSLEHDVGELVVAVHEPGDVVDRPVRPQPRRRLVEARQLAPLDPLQERGPAIDLPFVEALRSPQVGKALRLPVDLRQQGDALDQLEGQPAPLVQVGIERRRPLTPCRHGRPAVDEAHQVKGAPQHGLVRAQRDGLGVRHVRAAEGLDDAPLAHDPLVARRRGGRRRDPHGAVQVPPAQLVDLVLAAARDVVVFERRPHAQPLRVEPGRQPLLVGDRRDVAHRPLAVGCRVGRAHRFPTSASR